LYVYRLFNSTSARSIKAAYVTLRCAYKSLVNVIMAADDNKIMFSVILYISRERHSRVHTYRRSQLWHSSPSDDDVIAGSWTTHVAETVDVRRRGSGRRSGRRWANGERCWLAWSAISTVLNIVNDNLIRTTVRMSICKTTLDWKDFHIAILTFESEHDLLKF